MGWSSNSTVCAAESRRNGRQRGFTTQEVERLAAIFGVSLSQLTTRCANCGGDPPAGFACLTCGARLKAIKPQSASSPLNEKAAIAFWLTLCEQGAGGGHR